MASKDMISSTEPPKLVSGFVHELGGNKEAIPPKFKHTEKLKRGEGFSKHWP